jgi:sterol desaturase/sphingolipid hydroxylase (fatty acid hydroxylase superfamily)
MRGPDPDWLVTLAPWAMVLTFVVLAIAETRFGARADPASGLRRPATNLLLGVLTLLVAALLPIGLVGFAAAVAADAKAPWPLPPMSFPPAVAAALLLRTLAAYWAHRASHRIGWLWRLHRVHHSDTAIDATTGFRHHPLEQLVPFAFALVPIWLFGLPPAAVALAEIVLLVAGLAEHANVRTDGELWRHAARLFVTPAVHLVHHSSRPVQTDSNFGPFLTLWDRLFGTWRAPDAERVETLGLGPAYDRDADRWGRQLLSPFVREAPPGG